MNAVNLQKVFVYIEEQLGKVPLSDQRGSLYSKLRGPSPLPPTRCMFLIENFFSEINFTGFVWSWASPTSLFFPVSNATCCGVHLRSLQGRLERHQMRWKICPKASECLSVMWAVLDFHHCHTLCQHQLH